MDKTDKKIVMIYDGKVVPVNSHKRDHTSSGDHLKNELKKAGSSFFDWLSKLVTRDNTLCVNCLQNPATRKCDRRGCCGVKFCSKKCHDEKYQQYQHELGEFIATKKGSRNKKFSGTRLHRHARLVLHLGFVVLHYLFFGTFR